MADGVEVAEVGVEEGWADSGQDLVDPVCVPTAGIVHPMWWALHAINKPALSVEAG